MDQQAQQLRQLVQKVRRESVISTGPPLLVVVNANAAVDLPSLLPLLQAATESHGVKIQTLSVEQSLRQGESKASEQVDWLVVNAGAGFSPDRLDVWQRASRLLLVTTTDEQAILDAYAALKLASRETALPPIELVVVDPASVASAQHAFTRLNDTCQRFLSCEIAAWTHVAMSESEWIDSDENMQELVQRLLSTLPCSVSQATQPVALPAE